MKLKMQKNKKGSLLILAVVLGFLTALMMIPVMQFTVQTTRYAHSTRASDQAFYAAEGSIARALSYVMAVGAGSPTGIYDQRFAVLEAQAFYPFGNGWHSMDEGLPIANGSGIAAKTRIFFDPAQNNWIIESVGRSDRPKLTYRTVQIRLSSGSFARYAFFNSTSLSAIDGRARWLAAGERFTGPVHSNRHLFVRGTSSDPLIFDSEVTIVNQEVVSSSQPYVEYNGLKDTNAEYIELPSNLTPLILAAQSGGIDLPADDPWVADPNFAAGDPSPGINNYRFQFHLDGNVKITNLDAMQWLNNNGMPAPEAEARTSFFVRVSDTNGAIIVRDGNAFISGTINGKATVAALANDSNQSLVAPFSSTMTDGNVILEGNIIYASHPKINGQYDVSDDRNFDPAVVTDMLGIIAERNLVVDGSMPTDGIVDAHIMVTGQASPNPDVRTWSDTTGTVSAAINQDGGFYIEDGNQRDLSELWTGVVDGEPGDGNKTGTWKRGNLFLTGGVVHFLRGQTSNNRGGFSRRYAFDNRLLLEQPPFYPLTPDLEIIGWRDISSTTGPHW